MTPSPLHRAELVAVRALDRQALPEGVEALGLRETRANPNLVEKYLHQVIGFWPFKGGRISVKPDHFCPPSYPP